MNPMTAATVEDVQLRAGDYRATVARCGAALVALTFGGRALVRDVPVEDRVRLYSGSVLAPWPNRLGEGRYEFDGATFEVPVNEVSRNCALHGFVADVDWTVEAHTADAAELSTSVSAGARYPSPLELTARYALDERRGLLISVEARNVGDRPAPYGASLHPYLVAGPGVVDDWTVHLDAAGFVDVDPDRLLPTGVTGSVAGTALDFRTPRPVGSTSIDHAYTDLHFDDAGFTTATLRATDGSGVRMSWDAASPWVQLHTADRPEPEFNRTAMAVEPMTCPADAFRSGQGLIVLAPGERRNVSWRIDAVTAD
jgi:aldose 1-epimerase